MGYIQEATDTKSESSVEQDMNSSSTSEAGQLPSEPTDRNIQTQLRINFINIHRVITKGSSQKALMNEGREWMHILIHKCSHTPANRGTQSCNHHHLASASNGPKLLLISGT